MTRSARSAAAPELGAVCALPDAHLSAREHAGALSREMAVPDGLLPTQASLSRLAAMYLGAVPSPASRLELV